MSTRLGAAGREIPAQHQGLGSVEWQVIRSINLHMEAIEPVPRHPKQAVAIDGVASIALVAAG